MVVLPGQRSSDVDIDKLFWRFKPKALSVMMEAVNICIPTPFVL